jgi:hypothetical protein
LFDEHRKFVRCILCGNTNLTREHIFGHALADYLAVKHHWYAAVSSADPATVELKKGSSPITNIAPPLLCEQCNTRRLTRTMDLSLPTLKSMCAGELTELDDTSREVLRRYIERIGLIVDVCTSNEQLAELPSTVAAKYLKRWDRAAPPVIDFERRSAWLKGGAVPEITVYIGHHTGVLGLNPECNVAHFRFRDQQQRIVGYAKRFSCVIHKLAVCVDIGMPFRDLPASLYDLPSLKAFPTTTAVTYDDYYSARPQDRLTTDLRSRFNSPSQLAQIEALSREAGTLTFP